MVTLADWEACSTCCKIFRFFLREDKNEDFRATSPHVCVDN